MNFSNITSTQSATIPSPSGVYIGAIYSNTVSNNYLSLNTGGSVNGNVNTTSLFTNKIGIGTTTTTCNLYVSGSSNSTILGNLGIGTTDTTSNRLNVNGNTNLNGFVYVKSSIIQDNSGQSNIILGNVGIGTTNPLNSNLTVAGKSYFTDNIGIGTTDTTTYKLNIANGDANIGSNLIVGGFINQNNSSQSNIILGNVGIGTTNTLNSNLTVAGKSYFTDNIGIGTTDTTTYKLNVANGDTNLNSNLLVGGFINQNNSSQSNIFLGRVGIGGSDFTSNLYISSSRNTAILGNVGIGTNDTSTYILNVANGDANIASNIIVRGFINQNNSGQSNIILGNVGIGTTNPLNSNLMVAGKSYFTDNIGIGTTDTTTYKLNVANGDVNIASNLIVRGYINQNNSDKSNVLLGKVGIGGTDFGSNLYVTGNTSITGKLAIGTTDTGIHKVNVIGGSLNAASLFYNGTDIKTLSDFTNYYTSGVSDGKYLQITSVNTMSGSGSIILGSSGNTVTINSSGISLLGTCKFAGDGSSITNINYSSISNPPDLNIYSSWTKTGNNIYPINITCNVSIGTSANTNNYKLNVTNGDVNIASNLVIGGYIYTDASRINNLNLENQTIYTFPPTNANITGNSVTLTTFAPQNGIYLFTSSIDPSNPYLVFNNDRITEFTINSAYPGGIYGGTYYTNVSGSNYEGEWIQLYYDKGFCAKSYSIVCIGLNNTKCPKSIVLAGSIDSSNWNLLSLQNELINYNQLNIKTFTLYNYVSYNYYRLIIKATNGNSNLSITELILNGTLNTQFTNNDKFNNLLYNTIEKRFPPQQFTSNSSQIQLTMNTPNPYEIYNVFPLNSYKQTFTVNDSIYTIYSSTINSSNYKINLFDFDNTTNATWASSQYSGGTYISLNNYYIKDSLYNGEWLIIKFPYSIILTKFIIISNTPVNKAPTAWKCYGSIDGVNWDEISEASRLNALNYDGNNTITINLPTYCDIPYLYIGWVFKTLGSGAEYLEFSELQIFGRDDIANSYSNVWNKFGSNIYNTLGNVSIGTSITSSYKLNVLGSLNALSLYSNGTDIKNISNFANYYTSNISDGRYLRVDGSNSMNVNTSILISGTGGISITGTGILSIYNDNISYPLQSIDGTNGDRIILKKGVGTLVYPYSIGIETDYMWYSTPATAGHIFYSGGISILTMLSGGNIGIGLTPGQIGSYKLNVAGSIKATSLTIGSTDINFSNYLVLGTSNQMGGNISFSIANSNAISITGNNSGISITGNNSILSIYNTGVSVPGIGTYGSIGDRIILKQGNATEFPCSIGLDNNYMWYSTSANIGHKFYSGGVSNLTISSNGYIGINTSPSATYRLDINGSINATYIYSNTSLINFNNFVNIGTANTMTGSINFAGSDGTNAISIIRNNSGISLSGNNSGISIAAGIISVFNSYESIPGIGTYGSNGDRIILKAGNTSLYPYSIGLENNYIWYSTPIGCGHRFYSGGTNTLTISTGGNVGIGTTDPLTYKLNVNGSINAVGSIYGDASTLNNLKLENQITSLYTIPPNSTSITSSIYVVTNNPPLNGTYTLSSSGGTVINAFNGTSEFTVSDKYNSSGIFTYTAGGSNYTSIISSNNSNILGEWIQIQYDKGFCATSLSITASSTNANNPKKFFIVGSFNNYNWNIIYYQANAGLSGTKTFQFYNSTPYNYYRFIVTELAGNSTILSFTKIFFLGTLTGSYTNNDKFNSIIYNTNEKQFPPHGVMNVYSEYITTDFKPIINDLSNVSTPYYKKSFEISNHGTYVMYYSSSGTNKELLFNYNTGDKASWNISYNGIGGSLNSYYIKDNLYTGDWIIIKLPYSIILTKFILWRLSYAVSAPRLWRCYGSLDGINWNEIVEGSNTGTPWSDATSFLVSISTNTPFLYIGWVFNALVGNSTTLELSEIQIFGKDDISNSYSNVWNKLSSNIYNNIGNVSIGTSINANNYKLNVSGSVNATSLLYGGTDINTIYLRNDINNILSNNISITLAGSGALTTANGNITTSNGNISITGTGKMLVTSSSTESPPFAANNGGTGDRIIFKVGAPSIYPYSIGIGTDNIWYSTPSNAGHKFYANGSNVLSITNTGITVTGNIAVTGANNKFSGDGSGLTNLDFAKITTSTIPSFATTSNDNIMSAGSIKYNSSTSNEVKLSTTGLEFNGTSFIQFSNIANSTCKIASDGLTFGSAYTGKITFNSTTLLAPTSSSVTNGGSGSRIVLLPGVIDGAYPCAIGVETTSNVWYSTPTGGGHKFYTGATNILNIASTGITVTGNIAVTGTNNKFSGDGSGLTNLTIPYTSLTAVPATLMKTDTSSTITSTTITFSATGNTMILSSSGVNLTGNTYIQYSNSAGTSNTFQIASDGLIFASGSTGKITFNSTTLLAPTNTSVTNGGNGSRIVLLPGVANNAYPCAIGVETSSNVWYSTPAGHKFYVNGVNKLILDSNGYVGIGGSGATTVAETFAGISLHVKGEIASTSDITAYYSDIRLKNITSNINNPLEIINSLNGFYYTPNDLAKSFGYSNDKQEIGLSAQEVQKVIPEIVKLAPFDMQSGENNDIISKSGENYLTINYARIVPVLIEAIKELYKEIIDMKNK